jgi:hypothetical protein
MSVFLAEDLWSGQVYLMDGRKNFLGIPAIDPDRRMVFARRAWHTQ